MDCAERGDTEAIHKPGRLPEPESIYEFLACGTSRWCRQFAAGGAVLMVQRCSGDSACHGSGQGGSGDSDSGLASGGVGGRGLHAYWYLGNNS
jgi:hypothetical protein